VRRLKNFSRAGTIYGGHVHRPVGVTAVIALALAFCSSVALAQENRPARSLDIRTALMLRLFGETSDASASFAAAYGDRVSESPLRALALQVRTGGDAAAFLPDLAAAPTFALDQTADRDASAIGAGLARAADAGLLRGGSHFIPAAAAPDQQDAVGVGSSNSSFTAAYQPVAPVPSFSPAPGTQAFAPLGQAGTSGSASQTLKVAGVQFEEHAQGASTQTPQLALRDNAYNAGATFDVRAGQRSLNLNLSGSYERVTRNDSSSFLSSTLDSTSWQLPGATGPLVIPNSADLNRFAIGAGVAVPVLRGLTLNLDYDTARLLGGYGLPGLVNLDAVNNSYGGKLTFDIPHTSSTLSISAYQNRYQDNILPINTYTQTREDVNFTVKF
jgi:hypothetical protein